MWRRLGLWRKREEARIEMGEFWAVEGGDREDREDRVDREDRDGEDGEDGEDVDRGSRRLRTGEGGVRAGSTSWTEVP